MNSGEFCLVVPSTHFRFKHKYDNHKVFVPGIIIFFNWYGKPVKVWEICCWHGIDTLFKKLFLLLFNLFPIFISAEKSCQDYKEVCLGVQNPDLILKIGDKELPAHRDILSTRSPVFESILCRNIKRKTRKTTFIDIQDCDPTAMEQLLLYVYCGKVETLDKSNMLGLYYAAEKYHMDDLKKECCSFIKKSLSCSNICGVSKLAFNHSDSGLIEHVTNYFCDNSQNILSTAEWHSFMKDNCATANELLKKSFDKLKNVKKWYTFQLQM